MTPAARELCVIVPLLRADLWWTRQTDLCVKGNLLRRERKRKVKTISPIVLAEAVGGKRVYSRANHKSIRDHGNLSKVGGAHLSDHARKRNMAETARTEFSCVIANSTKRNRFNGIWTLRGSFRNGLWTYVVPLPAFCGVVEP